MVHYRVLVTGRENCRRSDPPSAVVRNGKRVGAVWMVTFCVHGKGALERRS